MRLVQDTAPSRGSFPRFYLASVSVRLVACWTRAGGKPSLQKGPQIQIKKKKIETVRQFFSLSNKFPLEVNFFLFQLLSVTL